MRPSRARPSLAEALELPRRDSLGHLAAVLPATVGGGIPRGLGATGGTAAEWGPRGGDDHDFAAANGKEKPQTAPEEDGTAGLFVPPVASDGADGGAAELVGDEASPPVLAVERRRGRRPSGAAGLGPAVEGGPPLHETVVDALPPMVISCREYLLSKPEFLFIN